MNKMLMLDDVLREMHEEGLVVTEVEPIKAPPPFAPVDPKNPTPAEVRAAKKIVTAHWQKRRAKRKRSKGRRLRIRETGRRDPIPGEREWRMFSHDFDALYHALVQNPAAIKLTPKQFISRCEKIADEYGKMQARRCPKGVERF